MPTKTDIRLSDADWKIMHVLWRHDQATAREVHDELADETGWAYTTVKTMLDRLAEKRIVRKSFGGKGDSDDSVARGVENEETATSHRQDSPPRAAAYVAALSRQQARLQAARGLAERAFGGAVAPLVHFLLESEPLGDADRAELLRKLEGDGSKREGGSR
jgi:BlaI family penicillinase repressor